MFEYSPSQEFLDQLAKRKAPQAKKVKKGKKPVKNKQPKPPRWAAFKETWLYNKCSKPLRKVSSSLKNQ